MKDFELTPDNPQEKARKHASMMNRLRKEAAGRAELMVGLIQANGENALTLADLKWAVAYYALKPKEGRMLAFAREELSKREASNR